MDRAQRKAFKNLHKLNHIMIPMILVSKTLSEETMAILLTPMRKLSWNGKGKYADALAKILKKSKDEAEMIEGAKAVLSDKRGNKIK